MIELDEKGCLAAFDYFKERGWLKEDEEVLLFEKAGEGNMNVVLRLKTRSRSVVIKQSRPYVEKYRQVPAPLERITVEHAFYEKTATLEYVKALSPRILDFDPTNYVLLMEDLGEGTDFLGLYQNPVITNETLDVLVDYALALHSAEVSDFPDNAAMKALNHEHIFVYPFLENNGFDLDSVQKGLQPMAMRYKQDKKLKAQLEILGKRYLNKGSVLLHGDFYPGSWIAFADEVKVIDPEFAFLGDAEFDLAVMCAHLKMAQMAKEQIQYVLNRYTEKRSLNKALFDQFVSVEVLRRIVGLAQLPLQLSLEEKEHLLDEAKNTLLNYA
ncbi:phosphotransferase [Marinilongibacter aquaticus]|uniref:phosphotransferase n=1 Tax=Marinilongibacter aquaticus TaxID=2975157 RepID=UPI0021BD7890|nr:phosphotransferase [Marinilongibacter aquaticus]UBM57481.1 phosphotransferase [Marinilongibacter aquaticus]